MENQQRLLEVYREFPCRTLPNAFWKTAARLDEGSLDILYNAEGELIRVSIWYQQDCLAFWCKHPSDQPLSYAKPDRLAFALVHEDSLPAFPKGRFKQRQSYFRFHHEGPVKHLVCPPGFVIKDAHPEAEVDEVVRVIQGCYANMHVNPEIVRSWQAHPVYASELWVWIEEVETGEKAGLGIAELDPEVPEASLEWIQVLPEFQNRGLGTAMVAELLQRVEGRVLFSTVAGELENPKDPERLYLKCGFSGSDIWWYLAR